MLYGDCYSLDSGRRFDSRAILDDLILAKYPMKDKKQELGASPVSAGTTVGIYIHMCTLHTYEYKYAEI